MRTRTVALVVVVALAAGACGSDRDGGDPDDVVAASDPTAAPTPVDDEPDAGPTTEGDDPGLLSAVASDGWTVELVGEGTKPDLALDPAGVPGIAFLFENLPEGYVSYATAADGWTVGRVVEGYFYGPIGLDYDANGGAHIAYHDHQDTTFRENLGDLTYARRVGDAWEIQIAADEGHDGWDSTIRIGDDGVVRAAGVDPSQFDRVEGLEYYELVDGEWQVEEVGSGPLEYEWNVDLQVTPDGRPAITYFLTAEQDLVLATRGEDGTWTHDTVDAEGDVGRFSSFAYDAESNVHVAYWHLDAGEVRYATDATGAWVSSTVATLDGVEIGFEGARRITSLALDTDGVPQVAYSDVTGVWIAALDGDGTWTSQPVVEAGARPLGQLVSLEVDGAGQPHLAFFEVTGNAPLSGLVAYATPGG